MKNELGGKFMTEYAALRTKTYSYLKDDGKNDKKRKKNKEVCHRKTLQFNDYKDCLLNNKIILKSQQRFKTESHNAYTEEINKIALRKTDDKRLEIFDKITSYPYETSAGKVYLLIKYKWLILMIVLMKVKQNII